MRIEVVVRKLPENARDLGRVRSYKNEKVIGTDFAMRLKLDPFGKKFWLGSAETFGRSTGGGTTIIIASSKGTPLRPYNIIVNDNGPVAFFHEKSMWECSWSFVTERTNLMVFRHHDVTPLETIFRYNMEDVGMMLFEEWILEHNDKEGVKQLKVPKYPESEETWIAIDMLIKTQRMYNEDEFLKEGPENARRISQVLRDKALHGTGLIMHANLAAWPQCDCGRYIREDCECPQCRIASIVPPSTCVRPASSCKEICKNGGEKDAKKI